MLVPLKLNCYPYCISKLLFTVVCKPGDIICRDGTCVDISKRCDGKNDCAEGIDETNCGMLIVFIKPIDV